MNEKDGQEEQAQASPAPDGKHGDHADEAPLSELPTENSDDTPDPLAPEVESLPAGTQVGNYELQELLGRGGFGAVYKARDRKLDRPAAVKFLRSFDDAKHHAMFRREAKAIAKLSKHPNIVEIYAWGEYQGRSYFTLEYVASNLTRLISKHTKGVPVERALAIALQCAEALRCAHEQGVIHRDIKPDNILLEEDGTAKVADFGLTRLLDSPEATLTGTISGSPPYMSPEQVRGDAVDHRTDVFSLGVTLYQMLSGDRPFEGDTSQEIMRRIRKNERVPLAQRVPNLPQVVIDLVERAMAHRPEDRIETAQAFAELIHATLTTVDPHMASTIKVGEFAPRPRRLSVPLQWAAVTAIALSTVACIGLLLWRGHARNTELERHLSQAVALLDAGDAEGAARLYSASLEAGLESTAIWYGLGYALLRQGEYEESAHAFAAVGDESMRNEGLAALEYEKEGIDSRGLVEELCGQTPTPYSAALAAKLRLLSQDPQGAVALLTSSDMAKLPFRWQRDDYLRTLGQAYFHLNDYAKAGEVFKRLSESGEGREQALASTYLRLMRSEFDKSRRDEILRRAQQVRELMEQETPDEEAKELDEWTSRPLTFFVLRGEPTSSPLAIETGLADLLPMLLGDELDRAPGMNLVDREIIQDVLMEQALSAQLGSPQDRLRLGRVLGARLIIQCTFGQLAGEEFVLSHVTDAESTDVVPVERIMLSRKTYSTGLIEELSKRIREVARASYPIRGRIISNEEELRINVGKSVGIEEGMRFNVAVQPDTAFPLPGVAAVVEGLVSGDHASVRIEGMPPGERIPDEGLYAFQMVSR